MHDWVVTHWLLGILSDAFLWSGRLCFSTSFEAVGRTSSNSGSPMAWSSARSKSISLWDYKASPGRQGTMPWLGLAQRAVWLRRISTSISSLVLWYGGRWHKCRSGRQMVEKGADWTWTKIDLWKRKEGRREVGCAPCSPLSWGSYCLETMAAGSIKKHAPSWARQSSVVHLSIKFAAPEVESRDCK